MSRTRIAFVGSRGHYQVVLNELANLPDAQIVALADGGDTAAPILAWCAQHNQTPERFDDHLAMLDRAQPDMLIVCGPFEQHAKMSIDAIDRGVHVLTEKPAALTFEDLNLLRAACSRAPNIHLAGMMFSRYTPGFFTAHQLIQSGAIGEVRLLNARKSYKLGQRDPYYQNRETYGGTIPWIGSHAIDWILWLTGKPCRSVYAAHSTAYNENNHAMERSALCHFTLADEVFASISIDVFRPPAAPTHGDDWMRIVGTLGVMEITPNAIRLISAKNHAGQAPQAACDRKPLHDFLDHVLARQPAIIDARSTLAVTDACLRARQSADLHRVVDFAG